MKIKKRFGAAAAALLIFVGLLSGCSLQKDVEGGELIRQARKDYTALDSAKVIMTNMDTGEQDQVFTFKYDEKDVLMFSYYGKTENSEYAQYNNGAECFTYDNGEYTHSQRGDKDFVKFTRSSTHPQADAGLLIYDPDTITKAEVTKEDGVEHVHHEYDIKKIGAEVESGEVTDFFADYYFKDSKLEYFTETTKAKNGDKEETYAYKIEITQQNEVKKVENTTDRFKDK